MIRRRRDREIRPAPRGVPTLPPERLPAVDTELYGVEHGLRSFPWAYDVASGTGRSMSNLPRGRWYRGLLFRSDSPAVELAPAQPMPIPGGEGAVVIGRRA